MKRHSSVATIRLKLDCSDARLDKWQNELPQLRYDVTNLKDELQLLREGTRADIQKLTGALDELAAATLRKGKGK